MSAATKVGDAVWSAIISTSLGPAGMSIATTDESCCLALVTNRLPGPNILSTRGMDGVPYAIAAIACAPPMRYMWSIPHIEAA